MDTVSQGQLVAAVLLSLLIGWLACDRHHLKKLSKPKARKPLCLSEGCTQYCQDDSLYCEDHWWREFKSKSL